MCGGGGGDKKQIGMDVENNISHHNYRDSEIME